MKSVRRVPIAFVAVLLLASVQGADVSGLQAPELEVAGHLNGNGGLGILQASDGLNGEADASRLLFRLQADTLRIETDSRPTAGVAGVQNPGDVETTEQTHFNADLRTVGGRPGHELTVIPGADAQIALRASGVDLVPEPKRSIAIDHIVDDDRATMGAEVPPSVRANLASNATLTIHGDLVLVLWHWDFVVQEGNTRTEYRTGHTSTQSIQAPLVGEGAGVGQISQAYIHATNASLTMLPGADPLNLLLLSPSFGGATAVAGATVTGRLASASLLSQDVELRGDAMGVTLDHTNPGLLRFGVTDAETYRIAGEAPLALDGRVAPSQISPPLLGVLAVMVGVAAVAAGGFLVKQRLDVAHQLVRWRLRSLACAVLQIHLKWSPECVAGLTLLAETERRRGRLAPELHARLRAARVLVDEDRIDNARRILHLFARLGREEDALAWFEACKQSDPGLLREMISEPLFRDIDQGLRMRAKSALGWDDPTGV